MFFGLNIVTIGAWSVTSLSTRVQSLFAAVGSVVPSLPARSMSFWIFLTQNWEMFGLALLFGWNERQPSKMSRKSDAAG